MSKSPFAGAPRVAVQLLTGSDSEQVRNARHDAGVRRRARRARAR